MLAFSLILHLRNREGFNRVLSNIIPIVRVEIIYVEVSQ
jgi:hypothetical protein